MSNRWTLACACVLGVAVACDNPFVGPDDEGWPDGRPRADAWRGADAFPGACDLLTNRGCPRDFKCTWVRVSSQPPLGQIGCVPDGDAPTGGVCEYGASGATTGFDSCRGGNVCEADPTVEQATGRCRAICDLDALGDTCGSSYGCDAVPGFFVNSDVEVPLAGVCHATCDPLSGTRDFDGSFACGGPLDPQHPDALGCYGLPSSDFTPTEFTCRAAGAGGHRTVLAPPYFANSCASGAVPLLYERSGSMTVVCVMTCEPRDCNTTIRSQAGGAGCWRGVAPYRTTDRGCAAAGEECKYLWWFEGSETPIGDASDGVGYCIDYTKYRWDRNMDPSDGDEATWTACRNAIDTDDPNVIDADFNWGCVSTASIPMFLRPYLPRAATRGVSLRPRGAP